MFMRRVPRLISRGPLFFCATFIAPTLIKPALIKPAMVSPERASPGETTPLLAARQAKLARGGEWIFAHLLLKLRLVAELALLEQAQRVKPASRRYRRIHAAGRERHRDDQSRGAYSTHREGPPSRRDPEAWLRSKRAHHGDPGG